MGEMCSNFPLPFSRNDTNIKTSLTLKEDYSASKIRPKDASTQCETGASLLMCNTLKQPAKWTHVKAAGSQVEVTALWSKAFCSHRHSASTPPSQLLFFILLLLSLFFFHQYIWDGSRLRSCCELALCLFSLFVLASCIYSLFLTNCPSFSLFPFFLCVSSYSPLSASFSRLPAGLKTCSMPDAREVLWASCWGGPVGRWSRPSSIPSICTGTFEIRMCDSICILFFYVFMYCAM